MVLDIFRRWLDIGWEREYVERFVQPQVERGLKKGIPIEELKSLWDIALEKSNEWYPPGLIFRDLIDEWQTPDGA